MLLRNLTHDFRTGPRAPCLPLQGWRRTATRRPKLIKIRAHLKGRIKLLLKCKRASGAGTRARL